MTQNGHIEYTLNRNSAAWANVFRNSPEIRDGLRKHGNELTRSTGGSNYDLRTLRYTPVAVIHDPKRKA